MRLYALAFLFLPACLVQRPAPSNGGTYGGAPANEPEPAGPTAPSGPNAAAAPGGAPKENAGPQIDSVTLHNDCGKTVKLFLGDKPKWGSGTNTTIGSNTTQSYTLGVGKMIWIVDESDNGVTSYVGQAGMHRIKITSGCKQFAND